MTSTGEFTRATAMEATHQCNESIDERITMSNCNQMSQPSNGKKETEVTSNLDVNLSLDNSSVDHTTDGKKNFIRNHKRSLQATIAVILILTSIALLSIPIIIYYIKSPGIMGEIQLPSHVVDLQTCQGTVHMDVFMLNSTKSEMMGSCPKQDDDTSSESDTLAALLYISSQLGNIQCKNILLSLCGVDHEKEGCIDSPRCSLIRDTVCAVEWRLAKNVFNISEPSFGCCSNGSRQPENMPPLNCTDEFILICDSICILSCEKFSQHTNSITSAYTKLFIFTGNSLMLGAAVVILLAVVKRKTMFTFPQVYLVFGNICLFVIGFCLELPFYLGQDKAFCSDPMLVFSLLNPTTVCQIVGFGVFSGLSTYSGFWFLHVFHILLKLARPFYAQKFEDWHYFKVVHAAEITMAVVLGCLPFAVISSMNKFTTTQFPAFACQPDDVSITFYTFVLPMILLQMTGISATVILAVVLYNHMSKSQLHKSSVLKLSLCCNSAKLHVSTPVVKIGLVFLSYTAVLVMNWISFTYLLTNSTEIMESIQHYSLCSAIGDNPQTNAMCDMHEERIESFSTPNLTIASNVMLGFVPLFSIIYIMRVRNILRYATQSCHHDINKEQETQYS